MSRLYHRLEYDVALLCRSMFHEHFISRQLQHDQTLIVCYTPYLALLVNGPRAANMSLSVRRIVKKCLIIR